MYCQCFLDASCVRFVVLMLSSDSMRAIAWLVPSTKGMDAVMGLVIKEALAIHSHKTMNRDTGLELSKLWLNLVKTCAPKSHA